MNEQLRVIISAEIDKFKQSVESAQNSIKGFKEQVADASKEVDDKFKNIGSGIANGAKAAAAGLAAIGGALLALGASTQEYRNEQAKLVTAFETAGSSAEQAKTTYNDLFRVLGDGGQATEAANHLAKLTTEEKALSEWTTICQGVYATFGASLPIESLTEAANETAKTGSLTGALADALNWAGVSEDAFQESLDKCNTEAEREALIRETLNGLYDEAAATYEENNAQVLAQNEAQARLQETTAALGEAVAPVLTAFTSFASDALAVIIPYVQQLAEQYMPALSEVLNSVASALESAFTWASQHKEILMVVGGLITGIATAIGIYNAVAAVKAAMAAAEVTTVWALVAAYAAQAAAMIVALAPYLLIVAAIAAVIAIIVLCVKHWDEIKEAIAKAWEFIKEKTAAAVDAVVGFFKSLWEKITNIINSIKETVGKIFGAIKDSISNSIQAAKDIALSIFDGIKNGIQNKIETAKAVITNVVKAITSIFKGDFGAAKEAVLNIFEALKNGIKTKIENAKNTVKNVIDAIKGFFNFKFSWPNIPMPHFGISPSGWKVGDLLKGSIPKLSISWYAEGGVFDEPTLFGYGNGMLGGLGERGAEAVVPLEKNTEWLDKIAARLNGNGRDIILQVDGTTFGRISCDSINQLTKQTGSLPIKVF